MAITITHGPDMDSLAVAGYYAGAGQDLRWREEMAFRERSQMRQMQLDFMRQQMQQQFMLDRMTFGAQIDQQQQGQRFAQQAILQQDDNNLRRELADLEVQDRIERMQMENKNRLMLQRLAGQSAAEADENEFMYRLADDKMSTINDMLSSGYEFAPEDQQRYVAAVQEIERVMNDESLRPHQKAQAAMKAAQLLPTPTRKLPTPDDLYNQAVTEKRITLPDGRVVTERWAMDRNGTMHLETTYDPADATNESKSQDAYLKAYKDAAGMLQKKTAGGAVENASHEAIDALARKMLQAAEQWSGGGERTSPPPTAAAPRGQQAPRSQSPPAVQYDAVYDPKTGKLKLVEPSQMESLGLGAM